MQARCGICYSSWSCCRGVRTIATHDADFCGVLPALSGSTVADPFRVLGNPKFAESCFCFEIIHGTACGADHRHGAGICGNSILRGKLN